MTGATADRADVIVVGGGVVGSAVSWQAAVAGHAVTLIADEHPGASGAAAGMLAPSFEAVHHRAVPGLAPLLTEALTLWPAFAAALTQATDAPLDYQRNGIVAVDEAADILSAHGTVVDVPRGIAATRAVLIEGEGQVDPRLLVRALRNASEGAGVRLVAGRASRLDRPETPASVMLEDGRRVSAPTIVLATGASDLLTDEQPPVVPVRGRAFRVELPPSAPKLSRVVRSDRVYLCPKSDGAVYVGATEEPPADDSEPTEALLDLWHDAIALYPPLEDAKILTSFDGLRPATATGMPIIERLADQPTVITASGHDRNGVLLTPLTASRVLQLL